jgi:hypothetical protein
MSASIKVDRSHLHYSDGPYMLKLKVEWSCVAKTEDCLIDFEIAAGDLQTWTDPAGELIGPVRREQLLDDIAEYYSHGPKADIIGPHGQLLRGQSKYRFYLHIPPAPSHYHEVGRFLAIPMATPAKGAKAWDERYVMDFTGRPRVDFATGSPGTGGSDGDCRSDR